MDNHLYQGSAHFFVKEQIVNILGFVDHRVCSVWLWKLKAAIDSMQMNEHGCVPIKLLMSTNI